MSDHSEDLNFPESEWLELADGKEIVIENPELGPEAATIYKIVAAIYAQAVGIIKTGEPHRPLLFYISKDAKVTDIIVYDVPADPEMRAETFEELRAHVRKANPHVIIAVSETTQRRVDLEGTGFSPRNKEEMHLVLKLMNEGKLPHTTMEALMISMESATKTRAWNFEIIGKEGSPRKLKTPPIDTGWQRSANIHGLAASLRFDKRN